MEITALSCAAAELDSVTLDTSLILFSTETIISDCWTLAAAISSIRVLMDWMYSLMTRMAETVRAVDSVSVFT